MSDATLVAAEIQDLATSVGEVAAAVREQKPAQVTVNVPDQPPPQVHVNVPEAREVVPPVVNVNVPSQSPPVVNVAPAAVNVKPQISVLPSLPSAYEVTVTQRDSLGFIRKFTITPL